MYVMGLYSEMHLLRKNLKTIRKRLRLNSWFVCFFSNEKKNKNLPEIFSNIFTFTLSSYSCWCTEEIWQPFTPTAVVLLCSADITTHISQVNIPLSGLRPSQGTGPDQQSSPANPCLRCSTWWKQLLQRN